jgi:hypothetical protein
MSPSHPFAPARYIRKFLLLVHHSLGRLCAALRAYASSMTSMQQQLIVTSDDFASKAFQGDPLFHS